MFKKIQLVIFILFHTIVADEKVSLVCEGEFLIAECPKGSSIEIISAVYGKQVSGYCNTPGNNENNCAAESAFHLVQLKCNYKQMCKIQASNGVFGDPCVGTRKYLQVTYKCISGESVSKTVCEHETLNLKCPIGHIIKVAHALYGRTEQFLCYRGNFPVLSNKCGNEENSTEIVESRCENLQECTIKATNDLFGDPCVGTYKYLQVDFQCLPNQQIEQNVRLACEGDTIVLDCPKGSTIDILTASYGKKESKYCNTPGNRVSNCEAGNALNIVKFRCNRKQICKVPSSNGVFGDPCYGTRKYLEVTYECMTGNVESEVACEGDALTISCPDDQILWTANALYGRKNPLICNSENVPILTNYCDTGNAINVVQARCDNLQKCTIVANNDAFGDPCVGTHKYLEVDYQCLYSGSEFLSSSHLRIH